jgi:hypothetical protein
MKRLKDPSRSVLASELRWGHPLIGFAISLRHRCGRSYRAVVDLV